MFTGKTANGCTRLPVALDASYVVRVRTVLAYAAFGTALFLGSLLHYKKIVKNSVAGYPEEWFPSVSATIGDWYPERNIFQILIALTSGPHFALSIFQYYLHYSTHPTLATIVFVAGFIRTLLCGGWVYITSSEDHDVHDVCMILYIVSNIPWMIGGIKCTSKATIQRRRTLVATVFFTAIIPLIYFFIQHKVHEIPGAYTYYSFIEWGLILADVLYDSLAEEEFREANLKITLGVTSATNVISALTPATMDTDRLEHSIYDNVQDQKGLTAVVERHVEKSRFSRLQLRPVFNFTSDVYLSYLFWSTFTALVPTMFYFSVWELGIAGHEFTLLLTLSPLLFKIRSIFRWMQTKSGQAFGHLMGMAAIGAAFLETPGARLLVVAPAVGMAVLRAAAEWSSQGDIAYRGVVAALGFIISTLFKLWNYSNNPVWPFVDVSSTKRVTVGLFLGLIAVFEQYTRPRLSPFSVKPKSIHRATLLPNHGWLLEALPLGSLLFSLHNHLGDPSTLVAWSWTGYSDSEPKGPLPHVHAPLTLVAQTIGLLIFLSTVSTETGSSPRQFQVLEHPLWFAFGAATTYVMYAHKNWLGYAGGLGFAVFLMSILPGVLARAALSARKSPAGTWAGAMTVYCVLLVSSVLTVAYAFVPGGQYFREKTGSVLIVQMACLALAFDWSRLRHPFEMKSSGESAAQLAPSAVSFSKVALVIIAVLSMLGTLSRWPSSPPIPFKPGPRVINAGIWTVHFGLDNAGRDSQRGIARLISDMQLDIVGFLETDLHRTTFGHRDLTRFAVEELGYYVDIGPGPNAHTWGAALLSKFPIINSTHHLLPSPHGELAPAIEAVLDVYGTEITIIVSHNGQEEDPLDRELQSKELGRIMAASYPRPVIFLGYLVTKPHAERPSPYKYLVEDGRMHDIDDEDSDRWCEYILYRGLYRTAYARVSRGTITDTELQIGQFTLPRHGVEVANETREARYLRSPKEMLPEHHWFPMAYYGDENGGGVNGHFYHVFGTPLYYDLPEGAVL